MSDLPLDDLNHDFCVRVAVSGPSKAGKTSVLSSFCCSKSVSDHNLPSAGPIPNSSIFISSQPVQSGGFGSDALHRFEYWEIPSTSDTAIVKHLFSRFAVHVFVIDVTDKNSLSQLDNLFNLFLCHSYQTFIVLGNKVDSSHRRLSEKEIRHFLNQKRSSFVNISDACYTEVSVNDNLNVFDALHDLQVNILRSLENTSLTIQEMYSRGIKRGSMIGVDPRDVVDGLCDSHDDLMDSLFN
ncbi:hypothetical protein GEMRC1_001909 [Eukaryota sp. GEM-RC1]